MTELEVCALVRKQLAFYIKEAINGDELLMKEVWEELDATGMKFAKDELHRILRWLQSTEARR